MAITLAASRPTRTINGGPVAPPPELLAGVTALADGIAGDASAIADGEDWAVGDADGGVIVSGAVVPGVGVAADAGRAVGLGVAFGVGLGVGFGVGLGVGLGVDGAPTTITLPLKPWIVHVYVKVPARPNVCAYLAPCCM